MKAVAIKVSEVHGGWNHGFKVDVQYRVETKVDGMSFVDWYEAETENQVFEQWERDRVANGLPDRATKTVRPATEKEIACAS
jgi:hypothetical protein